MAPVNPTVVIRAGEILIEIADALPAKTKKKAKKQAKRVVRKAL
jgi:hypothetical protein